MHYKPHFADEEIKGWETPKSPRNWKGDLTSLLGKGDLHLEAIQAHPKASSGADWASLWLPCRGHGHLQPWALLFLGSQNNPVWNVQLPAGPHGGTHL